MRITKKHLNKLVYIEWHDVWSCHRISLKQAIDKGYSKYATSGWVLYADKEKLVIATEKALDKDNLDQCDVTYLHPNLITKIELLQPLPIF